MRHTVLAIELLAIGLIATAGAAVAQPYPYETRRPLRADRAGYNCEALQGGFNGPQPFSCPLPGARPLGTRCYCEQPIALFSGPRPPLVGAVVP